MVCEALLTLPDFQALPEQEKHIVFCGALMHDIEKRSTTSVEYKEREGRECVIAPGHAKKGEVTARSVLYKDIPTPFHIREEICKIVRYHGIPLWSIGDEDAAKRAITCSHLVRNDYITMVAKADILGRECHDKEEQFQKAEFYEEFTKELECYNQPRAFESDLARFTYLSSHEDAPYPDYVPFDETKFEAIIMVETLLITQPKNRFRRRGRTLIV